MKRHRLGHVCALCPLRQSAGVDCLPRHPTPHPPLLFPQSDDDYLGPSAGCTAVTALVRNGELWVANAGDSRCVLSRGGRCVQLGAVVMWWGRWGDFGGCCWVAAACWLGGV